MAVSVRTLTYVLPLHQPPPAFRIVVVLLFVFCVPVFLRLASLIFVAPRILAPLRTSSPRLSPFFDHQIIRFVIRRVYLSPRALRDLRLLLRCSPSIADSTSPLIAHCARITECFDALSNFMCLFVWSVVSFIWILSFTFVFIVCWISSWFHLEFCERSQEEFSYGGDGCMTLEIFLGFGITRFAYFFPFVRHILCLLSSEAFS